MKYYYGFFVLGLRDVRTRFRYRVITYLDSMWLVIWPLKAHDAIIFTFVSKSAKSP